MKFRFFMPCFLSDRISGINRNICGEVKNLTSLCEKRGIKLTAEAELIKLLLPSGLTDYFELAKVKQKNGSKITNLIKRIA